MPTTKNQGVPIADAPSEGSTGAGGAGENEAPQPRLPVPSDPAFTTFGGAAGAPPDEAGFSGEPGPSGGAKSGSGGAKPIGGAAATGGAKTTGGAAATGGAKTTGGAAATGGAKGAGGALTAGGHASTGDAGSGGDNALTEEPPLLFSEYVEGSGSFKALEIYAFESTSLEGCELDTYFNGKLEPARLALHGELGPGGVQVLCSSALAAAQPAVCDRSTSLTFNGDDALALSCDGVVLDVFGQIGVDPGDSWGMGKSVDHTLRRRCSASGVHDGTQPFDVDAEWITFGVDTFSDLGKRDCPLP